MEKKKEFTLSDFKDSISFLGLNDFYKRILCASPHGELFHLIDYGILAKRIYDTDSDIDGFSKWFRKTVNKIESGGGKPNSFFMDILRFVK